MATYRWLADAVVALHAAYVGFVIAGLLAVLVGFLFHWRWVRNFWFRWIHFLMITVVVVESLFGIKCPLTTWEEALRLKAGEEVSQATFIGRWANAMLFYQVPDWVFTIIYCVFGAMVLAVLVLVPPRRRARRAAVAGPMSPPGE
jgi:MFS family permease